MVVEEFVLGGEITLEIFKGFGSDIVETERDFIISFVTLQCSIDDTIMTLAVFGDVVFGDEVGKDLEKNCSWS